MEKIVNQSSKKIRALGLCSGGLDSILSALVLKEQGIGVEWVVFETPFFSTEKAEKASRMTQIPLTVVNITEIYLPMLKNPPAGYGKQMNPCMDCHALMFYQAGKIMESRGIDFLFSGEVLGQRPKSQTKNSLRYVEKHSGYAGYILRPLSAKKLPETVPEEKQLVDRNRLYDLSGRSRKSQMKLAEKFSVTDYPAPAGGCLLTEKAYSQKLKDLLDHEHFDNPVSERDLHLLKPGRHFRLNPRTKIIVGRTSEDNRDILAYYNREKDVRMKTKDHPGPTVLMPGGGDRPEVLLAASVCAAYSKAPDNRMVSVKVTHAQGREHVDVLSLEPGMYKKFRIN